MYKLYIGKTLVERELQKLPSGSVIVRMWSSQTKLKLTDTVVRQAEQCLLSSYLLQCSARRYLIKEIR